MTNWTMWIASALALGVSAGSWAQASAALTPEQLVAEVRAQQNPASPSAAAPVVPAPPAASASSPGTTAVASAHRLPTVADKHRLETQLADVDSALKIHDVEEASTQRANGAIALGAKMLFSYADGGIYQIEAATFHETAIELQPGETLTGQSLPTAGDTARWTLTATKAGAAPNEIVVLIVKPLEADIETNMTITTNRRLYNVLLHSSEHTYMPLVGWLYPQDEAQRRNSLFETTEATETKPEALAVEPEKLNFDCAVSGSDVPWRPIRVYDDGSKTYLQMSPEMASYEAPAFFVMEKKDPLLVNYRVKQSVYIVDRLFEQAQLRVGPKSAVDIHCKRTFATH